MFSIKACIFFFGKVPKKSEWMGRPHSPGENAQTRIGGAVCHPPPLETGVAAGAQYVRWAEASGPPTPTSVYAHPPCQKVFTPLSSCGNSLQALQVGIVLFPPWARAPSKNSTASALHFSLRRGLGGRSWALRLLLRPFCRKAHLFQAPSPLQAHGQRRRAGS